jgi:hypothetical protein
MLQRFVVSLLLAVLVLSTLPAALAQTSAHGHWFTDPKNVATPGFVYDVPPSDFNPLTASDLELQDWGFPPRPDVSKTADYDRWTRMVTAKRAVPQLIFTNIYHGPARNARIGGAIENAIASTSENWSGYAITQKPGTFYSKNDTYVEADWTVPSVSPPPGFSCSSATYTSAQWVGFDGWDSSDVLQAGTEANCGNSDYVWYEWYPYAQTKVSSPTAGSGNSMFIQVWYTTTGAPGNAYFWNKTTNVVSAVAFYPKPGTTLSGNSIEWVVERITVNNVLSELVNYGSTALDSCQGDVPGFNGFIPNVNYTGTDAGTYQIDMTCPPWVPSSSCTATTVISTSSIPNPSYTDISFSTAGPAR